MDDTQRRALLKLVRDLIEAELAGRPRTPRPSISVEAKNFGGAFVTLRKAGRLRGCMGRFQPDQDLVATIQEVALSALDDPRFQDRPVTLDELPAIDIEISVLSALERTDNPLSLQPGVHGVYLRQGYRAGCFLPQVATEQGWGREEFLSRCCSGKAGLPANAWKDPQTEVHLFTAEVFGEKEISTNE